MYNKLRLKYNSDMTQLTLGQLKEELELLNPELILEYGFSTPHSYRGYYNELAFEPASYQTVADLLKSVEQGFGTFSGYKGGNFTMDEDTLVNIAEYGECSFDNSDVLSRDRLGSMIDSAINESDFKSSDKKAEAKRKILSLTNRFAEDPSDKNISILQDAITEYKQFIE